MYFYPRLFGPEGIAVTHAVRPFVDGCYWPFLYMCPILTWQLLQGHMFLTSQGLKGVRWDFPADEAHPYSHVTCKYLHLFMGTNL